VGYNIVSGNWLMPVYSKLVTHIYQPPQISDTDEMASLIKNNYALDFRRVFIEHPRVRFDGVYIAIYHYMCVVPPELSLSFFYTPL